MAEDDVRFRRLGKRELGRYAFEERMPNDIALCLERDGDGNSMSGVILNLAKLLEHAGDVEEAYLCAEHTLQVWKLPDEGAHFCGYRNIQMLWSAIDESHGGDGKLPTGKPTVPKLQSMIENAWDNGFNAHGRILTGGISGTRKHIGTSEAEALFLWLNVQCIGKAFKGKYAWKELLDSVEAYFLTSSAPPALRTVMVTQRSPIFLQRPKHSLTILGIERSISGKRRLITFDPAWSAPEKMAKPLSDAECTGWSARWLLRRYRKSQRYLKRFQAFETLEIDDAPS